MDALQGKEEWTLMVGPGSRTQALSTWLAAPRVAGGAPRPRLERLSDMEEVSATSGGRGTLLLDADALPFEDLGYLRRFLAREIGWRIFLIGEDAGRRAARKLLRLDRVRWMSWPPDVEDLALLAAPAGEPLGDASLEAPLWSTASRAPQALSETPSATASARPSAISTTPPVSGASTRTAATAPVEALRPDGPDLELDPPDELHQIERILEMPPGGELRTVDVPQRADPWPQRAPQRAAERAGPSPQRAAERTGPSVDPTSGSSAARVEAPFEASFEAPPTKPLSASSAVSGAPGSTSSPTASIGAIVPPHKPPPWFRDQVADLADIAQRIELAVCALRDFAEETGDRDEPRTDITALDAQIRDLSAEVARLVLFTRTLGYLVSPPAPGQQVFDLSELLEVFVAGIVSGGADSPRCLFRSNGLAPVRSDRQLLSQAFDAFFFLAQSTTGRGEIVRVHVRNLDEPGCASARASIEFPAGPLADMSPARIVEPYALRRVISGLGSNALSAAIGIVDGQGGRAELVSPGPGRLEWIVTLPRQPARDGSPAFQA